MGLWVKFGEGFSTSEFGSGFEVQEWYSIVGMHVAAAFRHIGVGVPGFREFQEFRV